VGNKAHITFFEKKIHNNDMKGDLSLFFSHNVKLLIGTNVYTS